MKQTPSYSEPTAVPLASHAAVRHGNLDAYDQANLAFHDALFSGAHSLMRGDGKTAAHQVRRHVLHSASTARVFMEDQSDTPRA